MQSDRRPLSRRALLQSASVVPLVALGFGPGLAAEALRIGGAGSR